MTDWNELVNRIRVIAEKNMRSCKADMCEKRIGDREDFCYKHYMVLPRDFKQTLMRGSGAVKETCLAECKKIIARHELRQAEMNRKYLGGE